MPLQVKPVGPFIQKGWTRGVVANDVSTESIKTVAVTQNGRVFESQAVNYQPAKVDGRVEQDPRVWIEGLRTANRELVQIALNNRVELVGGSNSFRMHELVELDANGRVLANPTLWSSKHAGETIAKMSAEAKAALMVETGNGVFARSGIRLAWEKEHRPEVYRDMAKWTMGEGYLAFLMTDHLVSDIAIPVDEAGMTLLTKTSDFKWSDRAFQIMGLGDLAVSSRPSILNVSDMVGRVSKRAAAEYGLPEGMPWIIGGGDQTTGLAGNGGTGMVLGNSGVFSANATEYHPDPTGNFHFLPNGFGGWYYMVCTNNCGNSIKWLTEQGFAEGKSLVDLRKLAKAARLPRHNDGLIFLPSEGGTIHPIQISDANAKGGFFLETAASNSLAHKVAAVHQGVTAELAIGFKFVRKVAGLQVDRLILSGGGARDGMPGGTGYWSQMMADWTGVPCVINKTTKAGASVLGAAMFAGINPEVGLWPDLKAAQAALVRLGRTFTPVQSRFAQYAAQDLRFLEIFSLHHFSDASAWQKFLPGYNG